MALCVNGVTLLGFARACCDLDLIAGPHTRRLTEDLDLCRWYPFASLRALEDQVQTSYDNPAAILERVGMEMMLSWYRLGPGRQLIRSGIDFLHFQTGSRGYASLVRGPVERIGRFSLLGLDPVGRTALIHSTTPFSKDLERGVIIGGMSAPGDLDLVHVDNSHNPQLFHVSF